MQKKRCANRSGLKKIVCLDGPCFGFRGEVSVNEKGACLIATTTRVDLKAAIYVVGKEVNTEGYYLAVYSHGIKRK
ncbi:MAG: hypothetical protein WC942_02485 [Clostridia bacterium]|jgi:hypothetical protein